MLLGNLLIIHLLIHVSCMAKFFGQCRVMKLIYNQTDPVYCPFYVCPICQQHLRDLVIWAHVRNRGREVPTTERARIACPPKQFVICWTALNSLEPLICQRICAMRGW